MAEFDNLKMSDEDTVDDFAGKISGLASKSASLGTIIEEPKIVKKFLSGLPTDKYIQIVTSFEQVLDLNTTGFEDIVGRLKAYEERVKVKAKEPEQGKLMYASNNKPNREGSSSGYEGKSGNNRDYNSGGQGRGGGGYRGRGRSGRGRGRGRSNGQYREKEGSNNQDKTKRDLSHIQCWKCEKFGHYVKHCPLRPQTHESNMAETQEADALYLHEVVFLNEDKLFPKELENNAKEDRIWYLDNGASNHMTGNRTFFTTLDVKVKGIVRFGDGSQVKIEGKGAITFVSKAGERKLLKDVYFIPNLKHNIISLGQATEHGCEVKMKGSILVLKDPQGRVLVEVTRSANRLYKTPMMTYIPECLRIECEDPSWPWHARLGHVSFGVMKTMVDKEMVTGMPNAIQDKQVCGVCQVGKQSRIAFPKHAQFRAKKPLELVHGDLCGPISPPTPSQMRYVFVLIDDFSRYMWTMLLKEKSEALERFKGFKAYVENQAKIKTFRTDRGGEFTSTEFRQFCDNNGILRHLTAPYTPQQNGVVERRNRTLMEMTRSLLKGMKVPNYMWGEAVRHATYIINRVSTKALDGKTPYECFTTKKPNIEHLRIFGCIAYAKINGPGVRKLDDRSKVVINLGTEPGSKAYRLYDPRENKVIVSRDVVFDEKKGWDWTPNLEEQDKEPRTFVVSQEVDTNEAEDDHQNNDDRNNQEGDNKEEESNPEEETEDQGPPHQNTQQVTTRSGRTVTQPQRFNDYVLLAEYEGERLLLTIDGEPEKYSEAATMEEWVKAMIAELESIIKNKTWKLVTGMS